MDTDGKHLRGLKRGSPISESLRVRRSALSPLTLSVSIGVHLWFLLHGYGLDSPSAMARPPLRTNPRPTQCAADRGSLRDRLHGARQLRPCPPESTLD